MKDVIVHWSKTIDSTNLEAARCLDIASDLTVWGADFQSAGRGQRGNKWESSSGMNLTFSILFKPDNILSVNQFWISQITALAVVSYLKNNDIEARIKWPNDIYVEDRKICGILIENRVLGDKLSASIVGVGLNLNQREFCSDAPNPTSLVLEKGCSNVDVKGEFSSLLNEILTLYQRLETEEGCSEVESLYHERLYRLNEWHYFTDVATDTNFKGSILGVNKQALLRVETQEGQVREFAFKEIRYII